MNRSAKHAVLLALLFLVACETPATKPNFSDIRFTDEPLLRLDVAAVDIQDDFHPSFRAPNVEHLFPVSPEHAMENWARDRLQATGTLRRARSRRSSMLGSAFMERRSVWNTVLEQPLPIA